MATLKRHPRLAVIVQAELVQDGLLEFVLCDPETFAQGFGGSDLMIEFVENAKAHA